MPASTLRIFAPFRYPYDRWLAIVLLLLPLVSCGRTRTTETLEKTRIFAEILKRESMRRMGEDGFFVQNMLNGRDMEVRRWCAIGLARIGDPAALPILCRALDGGDAALRAAAAFAIGEIADRERIAASCSVVDPCVLPKLIERLEDPSPAVRMRAIEALGKIVPPDRAPEIARRLAVLPLKKSPGEIAFRSIVTTALGRLMDASASSFVDAPGSSSGPKIPQKAQETRPHMLTIAGAPQQRPGPKPDPKGNQPCGKLASFPESVSITDAMAILLAASRKNSTIAQVETTRGWIEIELFREDAPRTAERFVEMARRGVYDDAEFCLPKPSQTVETCTPKDWPGLYRMLPAEINMRPFDRGRVGMPGDGNNSDSGRFFITLAPQPYLDGVFTCFGHVVSGMQVADRLGPQDRIRRIVIRERVRPRDYPRH